MTPPQMYVLLELIHIYFLQINKNRSSIYRISSSSQQKKKQDSMPTEILNRLESLIPSIEASVTTKNVHSSPQNAHQGVLKSEMRAMKFIWNLPIISIDYLRWDEKYCGLCHRKYDDEFKVCARGESPCCLPCGHIAGHQCLRSHLSPYEAGNTKCPFLGCDVDFPQMFTTDPVEPKRLPSELAWVNVDESEQSDEELSRQVSQLSNDSGLSSYDIKRFLSIEEVLARSQCETEELNTGTEARDFATEARDPLETEEGDFPKNRQRGRSMPLAPVPTKKAVELISVNF